MGCVVQQNIKYKNKGDIYVDKEGGSDVHLPRICS